MSSPADELVKNNAKELAKIKNYLNEVIVEQKGTIENLTSNYFNIPKAYLKYINLGLILLGLLVAWIVYRYLKSPVIEKFEDDSYIRDNIQKLEELEELKKQNKGYYDFYQELRELKEKGDEKALQEAWKKNPIRIPIIDKDYPFGRKEDNKDIEEDN